MLHDLIQCIEAPSAALVAVLVDATVKASVVLLIAAMVAIWLRRCSAAHCHLIWTVAMLLLLGLPCLTLTLPDWQILPRWSMLASSQTATARTSSITPDVMSSHVVPTPSQAIDGAAARRLHTNDAISRPFESARSTESANDVAASTVQNGTASQFAHAPRNVPVIVGIAAIWLTGFLLVMARLIHQAWQLHRASSAATSPSQGALVECLANCKQELGVTSPITLRLSASPVMPMVWGLWPSRLMLPDEAQGWPRDRQRAVLLHELGHVARRDSLTQILVQFVLAIYWFHPAVWLVAWRIHVERERACDDHVLNRGVARQEYARHLLEVVSSRNNRPIGTSLGVGMSPSRRLEDRLLIILDHSRNRRPLQKPILWGTTVLAMAGSLPLAMLSANAAPVGMAATGAPVASEQAAVEPSLQLGLDRAEKAPDRNAVRPQDDEPTQNDLPKRVDDRGATRIEPRNAIDREIMDRLLAWGSNERHGWRVGAMLADEATGTSTFSAGELIRIQYFLQNVSDEPQSIRVLKMGRNYPILGQGGRINLNLGPRFDPIEIRAEPGEAVSPSGFIVELDSSGFPDGEYFVGSTAAFSIPDESGSRATWPWRVSEVGFRIGSGGAIEAEPEVDRDGICWSGTVGGLQVGMKLPDGQREWPVGSRLEADLFVRNMTDAAIAFSWDQPNPLDQSQYVRDSEGEFARLNPAFFPGAPPLAQVEFVVDPMNPIQLGKALLQIKAEPSESQSHDDPAELIASSGEFTWVLHLKLLRESMPGVSIVATAGPVPIEVKP